MSADRETTRVVQSWLEDGVTRLPHQLLDDVLQAVPHVRQRPAIWWRLPRLSGTTNMAVLTMGALAVAVLVGIGLLLGSPNVGPSVVPTVTPQLTTQPDTQVPAAGTWTALASMNEGRDDHTATLLLDGRVLVAGGSTTGTAELYDPTRGSWAGTGSMIEARGGHVAVLLPDGRVLVAGGYRAGQDDNSQPLASAELFDPETGSWTATDPMLDSRGRGQTATLLPDGRVLVVGGYGSADAKLETAALYDPANGSWTATGNMGMGRTYHTATLLPDGSVLVAGSVSSESSAELFDPSTGRWTQTGSMVVGRHDFTATLLSDGTVLASGAEGVTAAELYDPGSGTWTETGPMIDPRLGTWTATLLRNGTVLLIGGVLNGGTESELYDPSTGTWSAAASTLERRQYHTATLLPDGTVLVTGGRGIEASAELYQAGQ
jgi:WD40 repeat protein